MAVNYHVDALRAEGTPGALAQPLRSSTPAPPTTGPSPLPPPLGRPWLLGSGPPLAGPAKVGALSVQEGGGSQHSLGQTPLPRKQPRSTALEMCHQLGWRREVLKDGSGPPGQDDDLLDRRGAGAGLWGPASVCEGQCRGEQGPGSPAVQTGGPDLIWPPCGRQDRAKGAPWPSSPVSSPSLAHVLRGARLGGSGPGPGGGQRPGPRNQTVGCFTSRMTLLGKSRRSPSGTGKSLEPQRAKSPGERGRCKCESTECPGSWPGRGCRLLLSGCKAASTCEPCLLLLALQLTSRVGPDTILHRVPGTGPWPRVHLPRCVSWHSCRRLASQEADGSRRWAVGGEPGMHS